MRWRAKHPEIGERRTVTRFLIRKLELEGETRQFERARIVQEYREVEANDLTGAFGCTDPKWVDVAWGLDLPRV